MGLPVVLLIEEKAVFLLVFAFVLVLFFVAVAVLTYLLATSLGGILRQQLQSLSDRYCNYLKIGKKIQCVFRILTFMCPKKNCQRVMAILQRLWLF